MPEQAAIVYKHKPLIHVGGNPESFIIHAKTPKQTAPDKRCLMIDRFIVKKYLIYDIGKF